MKMLGIMGLFSWMTIAGMPAEAPSLKVLFVGNSQMSCYDLPQMIKIMSESAPSGRPRIIVGRGTVGGRDLKQHWDAGEGPGSSRALIASNAWDCVVIQEVYRPHPQEFEDYATRFDEAIRKAGARTILFATASVSEYYLKSCRYPDAFKELNDMQLAFGKRKGIPVAAAGYVWMKYLDPNPSEPQRLDLYDKDKGHPGAKGTYIYACLLYAVITGFNPEGLAHEFKTIRGGIVIPKDEALSMQKAAWAQYLENRDLQSVPNAS